MIVGLFMPYLCDRFFVFTFIFIMTNRLISQVQTHLYFAYFLEHALLFSHDNVDEEL